jgi:hypothetical protein
MSYDHNNPTTEGRPCGILGKKCPGSIKGCAHWRKEEVTLDNKSRMIENCMFVLEYELARQQVVEEMRTAATVHHGTRQFVATMVAIRTGQPIPLLSGNNEKDGQLLEEMTGGITGPPETIK